MCQRTAQQFSQMSNRGKLDNSISADQ